jgi:hypothetical protein
MASVMVDQATLVPDGSAPSGAPGGPSAVGREATGPPPPPSRQLARRGGRTAMPKIKPAVQWAIAIFLLFYIVHEPQTAANMVGDVFKFVSDFFHSVGNIISFHSNVN